MVSPLKMPLSSSNRLNLFRVPLSAVRVER